MDTIEIVRNVIKNTNQSSNKELLISLEYLNNDFEQTKTSIINLTKHLDSTEIIYNKILEEYKKRNNV